MELPVWVAVVVVAAVALVAARNALADQASQRPEPSSGESDGSGRYTLTDGRRSDNFERFTGGAKNVLTLSQDESQRRNHAYIGTEHILVGIVREGGSAAKVLKAADIDLARVREASAALVAAGSKPVVGEIALTASARRVLDSAFRATSERRRPIGPEHLLLSLLSEGGAAAILNQLRVDPEAVRAEVLRSLGDDPDDGEDFTGSPVPRIPDDGSGSAAATATPEDEASQ